jgi:two-component system, cell cycle sensor histidine kinase and response regulator CckA
MNEPIRILIVEDQPTDAELAKREICKAIESCVFQRVETREDYLAALEAFKPNLIITDYRMPRFDGLTALKLALEKVPFTPVIIMTGAINEDTAVECMKAGAANYIIKEQLKRLGQAVLHALEEKRVLLERHKAELALRESEERYRTLVHTLPDALIVADMNGNVVYEAPSTLRLYGYDTSDDLSGRRVVDWIHPDYQAKAHNLIEDLKTGRDVRHQEFILTKRDGSSFHGELSASSMRDAQGNVTGFLALVRDISDRKQAEVERVQLQAQLLQAQKMESIGRLAGGVAHDFNNMLSVILGYAELIQTQLAKENPLLNDVMQIERAGRRAKDITQQLLAFSRKQIIEPAMMDLNEFITGTQKGLSRLIGEDINLQFSPGADLYKIKFDRSQLDQILINLAANARDAMPQGGKLKIETSNVQIDEAFSKEHLMLTPGDYVLLTVTDSGVGMDKETLAHAFEPFFTTKAVGKGTGLGLATVYGIVIQGGGFIAAASEPGRGSIFDIYFPRMAEEATVAEGIPEFSMKQGTGRVLVVEDDPMVRDLTVAMLESVGYTVRAAETPSAALEYCKKNRDPIDLLITDVVMPELSGVELRDRIQAMKPDLKVLFISGYASDIIAHHGILDEGVNFIRKPFTMSDLAKAVQNVIQH